MNAPLYYAILKIGESMEKKKNKSTKATKLAKEETMENVPITKQELSTYASLCVCILAQYVLYLSERTRSVESDVMIVLLCGLGVLAAIMGFRKSRVALVNVMAIFFHLATIALVLF